MSRLLRSPRTQRAGRLVPAPPPIFFTERHQPGIRFTERMTGWWSMTPPEAARDLKRRDYERAFGRGRHQGRSLELVLTIETHDLEAALRHPNHRFRFAGTATITGLATELAQPQTFLARGVFKLFVPDPDGITSKQMVYVAELTGPDGEYWRLSGFKALRQGGGVAGFQIEPGRSSPAMRRLSLWTDQTRLYFSLWRPSRHWPPPQCGLGVLTLSASDFLRQLLTIRATKTTSLVEAYDTITRFVLFFGSVLRDTYGGPLARSRYAPPNWCHRPRRLLEGAVRSRTVHVETDDNVRLSLTHYHPEAGQSDNHVILAPGFGVRADSFAIDTVEQNLVEFLGANGYHVWLFDYRASPGLELDPSQIEFSIDHIAMYDWPAAIRTIRRRNPIGKVMVVAHCVGAMSFMMAALGGYLEERTIDTAILSQVGAHPIGSALNELKAVARLGVLMQLFGKQSLRVTVHATDTYRRPVLDRLLKYYPTEDPCDNPVCRRVRFVFGESYLHANLNRRTHDAIIEMFGDPREGKPAHANLRALRHLALILRHGTLVHEGGAPYVTRKGLDNLNKLQLRLCLMSGLRNAIFPKEGIEATQAYFERNGIQGLQEPIRLADFAHMDCFIGADAHTKVFPELLAKFRQPRRASPS